MIATISWHLSSHTDPMKRKNNKFFPCYKNSWDLLSQQLSYVSYSNVNYSHHAVYYIPSTYLSYNWQVVPFNNLPVIPPPLDYYRSDSFFCNSFF